MLITRRGVIRGLAGVATAGVVAGEVGGEDEGEEEWPTGRYDARNSGYAPGNTGPLSEIDEEWRVTIDNVHTSPAVTAGSVYIGDGGGTVYAFDRSTGDREWTTEIGDWVTTTPAVTDGVVYAGTNGEGLYALDADTGVRQWRFDTGHPSSPTVVDDTVYLGSNGGIHALDRETGEESWRTQEEIRVELPPAVAGDYVYAGDVGGTVYTIDRTTGNTVTVWEETQQWGGMSGVVASDGVYVSVGQYLLAYDPATGDRRWRFKNPGRGGTSAPAVVNEFVFVSASMGTLSALDRSTGEVQWTADTPRVQYSPPAVTEEAIYVGGRHVERSKNDDGDDEDDTWITHGHSYDGRDLAQTETDEKWVTDEAHDTGEDPDPESDSNRRASIRAIDRESGEELWSYSTSGQVHGTPAVVGGTVYASDKSGNIVALSGSMERPTPTPTPSPTPTPTPSPTPTSTPTPTPTSTPTPTPTSTPTPVPTPDREETSYPPDDGPIDGYDGDVGPDDDPDPADPTRRIVKAGAVSILAGVSGWWLQSVDGLGDILAGTTLSDVDYPWEVDPEAVDPEGVDSDDSETTPDDPGGSDSRDEE